MKKIYISLSIILLLGCSGLKSQWLTQYNGSPFPHEFFSLAAVDSNTAFVTSIFAVLKTTNGGTNWTGNFNSNVYFDDIQFINSTTGYLVGRAFNGSPLYITTNTGTNWNLVGNLPVLSTYSISFVDVNTGFASTLGGVYRTTDGGLNWVNTYTELTTVKKVFFVSVTLGWGVTDAGNLIRSTSGGNSWEVLSLSPGTALNNLFFINSNTGWVTSANSQVFKSTTNGWIPWSVNQLTIPTCELDAAFFVNDQTGWVAGCQGSIHRSVDGGVTWTQQSIGSMNRVNSIKFVNDQTGWAAGTGGVILKTTNGGVNTIGIQPISNLVPDKFSLSQNYPNPFNPSTKIQFEIMKAGNVKLDVFDVLGNEVENVVNESLRPGTYIISFDGSKLSSGIYYYKLQSGDKNIATKKMILLK